MRRQVKNCQRQLRTSEPAGLQKFPVLAWQLQGVEARSANTQEKEAVCDVFFLNNIFIVNIILHFTTWDLLITSYNIL